MGWAVIVVLYVAIGGMSAAGSVYLTKALLSPRGQQVFFALFLIPIAGFYLAFVDYFGNPEAWRLEIEGVIAFTVLGLVGTRVPAALVLGYALHGVWDVLHEAFAPGGGMLFGGPWATEIPLAYGVFCLAYDFCMAAYFYSRRAEWSAAWSHRQAAIG